MNLLANLDCEARWAGAALPQAVLARVSLYAALFAACAGSSDDDGGGGDEPHHLWLPAPIDAARLRAVPGWTPPVIETGRPPAAFDLAWADPAARDANDRSRGLAIARALGVALPGARIVGSLAELDDHLATGGIAERTERTEQEPARPPGREGRLATGGAAWVCKARWTAAGRDRAHGTGRVVDGELRRRLARLFARLGPLVFEPWLDRVADFGTCGTIAADGSVTVAAPHRLRSDARGGFTGIALAAPDEIAAATDSARADSAPVPAAWRATLQATARAAATRLAADTGYRGPFAVDAFAYRDPRDGTHHLHPLCELNARHSFGWIARGLARRLGARQLGFDPPPPGATVLIAPGDDRITAWCA